MSKFIQELPEWENAGSKPTEAVIDAGWQVKDRPPASWFNWAWNRTFECLEEIRNVIDTDAENKQNVPLIRATFSGNGYVATSPEPATALVDGMTVNVVAGGNSTSNATFDLDGLGAKNLVYDGDKRVRLRTMQSGRIYNLVYVLSTDSWNILNVINKIEMPPRYNGDIDQILYNSYFVINNPFTDGRIAPNDFALITTTTVVNASNTTYVKQVVTSVLQGTSWQRILTGTGTVERDWTEVHNIKYVTRNEDIFQNMSGIGLTGSFSGTNLTITSGHVYADGWFYEKISNQSLPLASLADGNINVVIAVGGVCAVYNSATAKPAGYGPIIGSFTKSGTTFTGYTRAVISPRIKAGMTMNTPALTTSNDTLATTKFVKDNLSTINTISGIVYLETSTTSTARAITIPGITNMSQLLNIPITVRSAAIGSSASNTTLNINSLGAIPILFPSVSGSLAVASGDQWVKEGQIYSVAYDGTNFLIQSVNYPIATTARYGLTYLRNDLVTTDANYALDARQGKILNDKINNLSPISGAVYQETSSSNNTRAITIPGVTSMTDIINIPVTILSRATGVSGSATTLNVNSLGAVQILFPSISGAMSASSTDSWVKSGQTYNVTYNGTNFIVMSINYTTANITRPGVVQLANNLTTTVANYALDARQGKALSDLIANIQPPDLAEYYKKPITGSVYLGQNVSDKSDGTGTTAIGANAGINNTANSGTFVGNSAGQANTTGAGNSFFGATAGRNTTTGTQNAFIGSYSGTMNATGSNNVAVGCNASYQNQSGADNVSVGYGAGNGALNASGNVFVGSRAGATVQTSGNVFIGSYAGSTVTAGQNIFIGYQAGQNATTPNYSVFIGSNAGKVVTTATYTVAVGDSAGQKLTTGGSNTFLGSFSGTEVTTGRDNVFVGYSSGGLSRAGAGNIFIGSETGVSNDSSSNIFIGYQAGRESTAPANIFIGTDAGYSATGEKNTFIGYMSGNDATTGAGNTFLGYQAGQSLTTGSGNVFIGDQAGSDFNGSNSIFIGQYAGDASTASGSVFIGTSAGELSSGSENTFIGHLSGSSVTTGSGNTTLGHLAGQSIVAGNSNVVIGNAAGAGDASISDSVFIGSQAGSTSTASRSVFIGSSAGYASKANASVFVGASTGYSATGVYNVAVGSGSGNKLTSGNTNTLVGYQAGQGMTSGSNNVMMGGYAGNSNVGSQNTFLGTASGRYMGSSGTYNTLIGYNSGAVYGTGTGQNGTSNYCIFIGSESRPNASGDINEIVIGSSTGTTTATRAIGGGSNTITLGNSQITRLRCQVTSITALSDERVKKNIEIADTEKMIAALRAIPVKRYEFDKEINDGPDKHRLGFIAQDVQKVFPKSVETKLGEITGEGEKKIENPLELTQDFAIPVLWGVVQNLVARVEELELKLANK